jgi:DNA-binding PadR family transcriptional regulator
MQPLTTSADSILMRLVKNASVTDSALLGVSSKPSPPGSPASAPPSGPPSFKTPLPGQSARPLVRDNVGFIPKPPKSISEAGLLDTEVSALILKKLFHRSMEAGFRLSEQLGLKLAAIEPVLRMLKTERLVAYKSTVNAGDYVYELTDLGRERGRELSQACTYFGTAPVPLQQYAASVAAQSIARQRPSLDNIRKAFHDLEIPERLLSNVGQAIHSGRGMFLFGNAGNGKTSIAERITKSYGDNIWIPRALTAQGEIIRLFDPNRHEAVRLDDSVVNETYDARWVCIRRPTVIAGGELRMENLEVNYIRNTGIGEAPLQLKANCGMLLIDDFGRQRMPVDELLNRWIVPLEQRHDFLHLESGRTIQTPFDELVVFSTNMEPKDLVEDAFLRRIPYKIEVKDPTETEFVKLFLESAAKAKFECNPAMIDYLLGKHYRPIGRSLRFCHPRDLIRQMENRCTLHELPRVVNEEALDQAVENYFSIM